MVYRYLFYIFLFFVVFGSLFRSTNKSYGVPKPTKIGSIVNWSICSSLSPSLVFRPCFNLHQTFSLVKIHPTVRSRSKLALLLLLSGDISTNPGPVSNIKIASANVRSIRNKGPTVEAFVRENDISCLCLTETFLQDNDTNALLKSVTPANYKLINYNHKATSKDGKSVKRGGGVGFLLDNRFNHKIIPTDQYDSFEHYVINVGFGQVSMNLVSVYRPPKLSFPEFFNDFQNLLVFLISLKSNFIITGDFNIHVDKVHDPDSQTFSNILNIFNLKQHVSFPTHTSGHTLDLLITTDDCSYISHIDPSNFISDHCALLANLKLQKEHHHTHKLVNFRQYNKIDFTGFKADLTESDLIKHPQNNASLLYNQYHTILTDLVNRYAPLKTKSAPTRPPDPWITDEIIKVKQKRRHLERTWRRTRSITDRRRLSACVHQYNRIISEAKNDWYSKLISENKENPKKLWSSINHILHRNEPSPLPDCSDKSNLANSFGNFFSEKISNIRTALNLKDCTGEHIKPNYTPPNFTHFHPITYNDTLKLISSSPNKSCDLDPCPTFIVKECKEILATPIMNIINLSLSEGIFPGRFKQALVTPLLKKPSLPKNELKNYRPVSNLNYLSKLLEKTVSAQIKDHIQKSSLENPYQSAYRAFHSTETALLTVQDNIYKAMGKGEVTALTLLDLSAAFDTIDHDLLLNRLTEWFGIGENVLSWLSSYLRDRFQSITIKGTISNPFKLFFGVPQGSVLGPLLFIMYTTPLSSVISSFNEINHHLYADDTQAFNSFNTSNFDSKLSTLKNCLLTTQDWMYTNKLKLNPEKTEFMLIGNKCHRQTFESKFPQELIGSKLSPSNSVRNLGVTFDSDFSFYQHINNVVKNCFYHIRDF